MRQQILFKTLLCAITLLGKGVGWSGVGCLGEQDRQGPTSRTSPGDTWTKEGGELSWGDWSRDRVVSMQAG